MDIEQLKTLVTAVELKSFSQTAAVLHISQPTVSTRIKALENELGQVMILRKGKDFFLTPAGVNFLNYAKQIVGMADSAVKSTREFSPPTQFVIGATTFITNYLLPGVLTTFLDASPVHVKVRTTQQYQLIEMLSSGIVDVALISAADYPKSLNVNFLWNERVSLVVGTEHSLLLRKGFRLYDLEKYPVIALNPDYEIPHYWERIFSHFQRQDRELNVQVTTDNLELAKRMLRRNEHIAFLPYVSIKDEVERGELAVIETPFAEELTCSIYLLSKSGEKRQVVEAFHRCIQDYASL